MPKDNAPTATSKHRMTTMRDLVQDMKPLDAVDVLLCYIEETYLSQDKGNLITLAAQGFTAAEARLLIALFADKSHCASMEQLFAQCSPSSSRPDGASDLKTVTVLVCRIRAKLRALGAQCSIVSIFGEGYRVEYSDDFDFFGVRLTNG